MPYNLGRFLSGFWINPKFYESQDKCPRCKEDLKEHPRAGPRGTEYEGKLICGHCELALLQEKRNNELKAEKEEVGEAKDA